MDWGRTCLRTCLRTYRAFVVVVVVMSLSMMYQSTRLLFLNQNDIHDDRSILRRALSAIRVNRCRHSQLSNDIMLHTGKEIIHTPTRPTGNKACYKRVQIWSHRCNIGNGSTISCPDLPCGVHQVEDTSLKTLRESDVVFFDPLSKWDWEEVHAHKQPGQVWVTGTGESPINTRKHIIPPAKYLNNTYDYVMSFRRHEGAVYSDYGNFDRSKPSVSRNDSRNWAEGKTRLAVWVAHGCWRNSIYLRWNRTEFVRALSKLVQVDMYGRCGDEECPRDNRTCRDKIQSHKFYLGLENSKCRNYITEKVWSNSFQNNLVPVVYGAPREDYELALPPDSFIFIEDFKNIKELADYLTLLDVRDDLYNRYHAWRKLGTPMFTPFHDCMFPLEMCRVVERMLKDEKAKAAGTYKSIPPFEWDSWWLGSCDNVKDFPVEME